MKRITLKPEKVKEQLFVRQPAVAGSFYPAEKEALSDQIEDFLSQPSELEKPEKPLAILIVPHAGYEYSGQVAALGFKQLVDSGITRVIVLGATHQFPFSGAAVFDKGFWETPLGKVEIDADLAAKIIEINKQIFANQDYHQEEHSLEVQLPFLQRTLKDFKVVPILMGGQNKQLIEDLASVLAENLDAQTVLVISSDLSHYPSYEDANKVDKKTIEAILSGKIENLDQLISQSMAQQIPNLATCACGEEVIKVGMRVAEKLGIKDIRLIKYANSGDVVEDKSRVVGYASVGFYLPDRKHGNTEALNEAGTLNREQQEELLKIARQTLENYLKTGGIPEFEVADERLNQYLGAFVTLRKDSQLRGCIGLFEPKIPLGQVVQQMVIEAATKDFRFPPVTANELKDIKIEISVMSPWQKIADWREIELGKHGVVVEKGGRSGVFLPQVATENNWDLETFMGQLCSQKAGLPADCWKNPSIDLYIFTAEVFEEE